MSDPLELPPCISPEQAEADRQAFMKDRPAKERKIYNERRNRREARKRRQEREEQERAKRAEQKRLRAEEKARKKAEVESKVEYRETRNARILYLRRVKKLEYKDIAFVVGVCEQTVLTVCNPDFAQKNRAYRTKWQREKRAEARAA